MQNPLRVFIWSVVAVFTLLVLGYASNPYIREPLTFVFKHQYLRSLLFTLPVTVVVIFGIFLAIRNYHKRSAVNFYLIISFSLIMFQQIFLPLVIEYIFLAVYMISHGSLPSSPVAMPGRMPPPLTFSYIIMYIPVINNLFLGAALGILIYGLFYASPATHVKITQEEMKSILEDEKS